MTVSMCIRVAARRGFIPSRGMHVPRLLRPFVCGQTFRLLLRLGIINSAAMNTGGMCLFKLEFSLFELSLFEVLPFITQRALKTSRSAPGVAGANHNPSSTLPSPPLPPASYEDTIL